MNDMKKPTRDELVKALRNDTTCDDCICAAGCNHDTCLLHAVTADMLENHETERLALVKEIEKLRKQVELVTAERSWISVKDKMPQQTDPAQKVLFVTKTGGLFIGCYYKATAYDQFDGWYSMCVRIDNVTHWMPLPEPPEEGTV